MGRVAERRPGVWRFASALPDVAPEHQVTLGEGDTPLLPSPRLAEELGVAELFLKDDSGNPTGTFKDRALAISAGVARGAGLDGLICASTGNAGASAAAYAARAGLAAVVLVPRGAPTGKLAQAQICGAELLVVRGTYSDAYALAAAAADALPYLNTTTTFVNPHAVDGGKTVGLELHEQMGDDPADWIVVPIGCGPLLVGIHEAFEELRRGGAVDRVPRLLAVQAAGCAPIVRAFAENADKIVAWGAPDTVVGALADPLVGYEHEGLHTLHSIRETNGAAVAVEDDLTLSWLRRIAVTEGLFVEPAAAITLAGLQLAVADGRIGADDRVACCLTGTGLKDLGLVRDGDAFVEIEATEEAIMDYLGTRGRG